MTLPADARTVLQIASSALESLALLVCIFRIWIRIRIHRLGWDDVWAVGAFICGSMNIVSDWIYIALSGVGEPAMTSMWIYMFTFTCLVWAVRISVIFSIIRIIRPEEQLHKYGLTIVALYLLFCVSFIVQKAVHCVNAYQYFLSSPSGPFHCAPSPAMVTMELAADCIADTVSVVLPLYVLRRVRLPSRQYRLLRLLFATSIVVSVVCCIRAVCQAVPQLASWSAVIDNFQVATCLIVGNVLVVVTYLYRVLGYRHDESTTEEGVSTLQKHDETVPPCTTRRMSLTTVELMFSSEAGVSGSAVDVASVIPSSAMD